MSSAASAAVLFSEDFTPDSNGRVLFAAAPVYDGIDEDGAGVGLVGGDANGNGLANGQITTSNSIQFPGGTGQGGPGDYFLDQDTGGGDVHAGKMWGTLTPIAVATGTNYTFSFYLNRYNFVGLQIQATINGVAVSPNINPSSEDTWQQFSYVWNSGAATTADLSLVNNSAAGFGNDFGVDTIVFSGPDAAVPVPSTLAFLGLGLAALGFGRRKHAT